MKDRRLESGIGDAPRNRRWSAVVETVLLLALAAGANPAQWQESPVVKQPLPQRATAAEVSRPPEVPASMAAHQMAVRKQHVPQLRALPGHYINLVLMCEQGFADVAKSLVGGIGAVCDQLHCGQALMAERLHASGLTLSDTASTEGDGCAL